MTIDLIDPIEIYQVTQMAGGKSILFQALGPLSEGILVDLKDWTAKSLPSHKAHEKRPSRKN